MSNLRRSPNLPQPVRLTNAKPSAEALVNKLLQLRDGTRPKLNEDQNLIVELHTPSGAAIRVEIILTYPDADDVLTVQGKVVETGETCAAVIPVQNFYAVFRITTVEGPDQKQPIGFRVVEAGPEQPSL